MVGNHEVGGHEDVDAAARSLVPLLASKPTERDFIEMLKQLREPLPKSRVG